MNITIVGAGNVGTQIATHCASKGHKVVIYSSKPEKICKELSVVDDKNKVLYQGVIDKATNDALEAFQNANLIFVAMPAMLMKIAAKMIEPFVRPGIKICLLPGTGGGECAFRQCIERGAIVFGVQRVPSVARLVEYGKCVRAIGYRKEIFVSAIPNNKTKECCKIIEDIIGIKTTPLPNYLNITLTPSNPILHPTRLKNIFGNWHEGLVYDMVPLFYEDWDNESSKLLLECDDELQIMCKSLDGINLSFVKSLKSHYEAYTVDEMTKKIRSISGFKGLKSPTIKVKGGYIPDFDSRYFVADFSYGLAVLIQIAKFIDIDVPYMKETMDWYYSIVGKREEYCFSDYGINNLNDFKAFYLN